MQHDGEGRVWSNGDRRQTILNGKTVFAGGKYSFSSWKLKSGVAQGHPLDLHLKALWRRLADYREQIYNLPDAMHGVIQGTGCFKSHRDPFVLSSGHYKTAAFYDLPLDFDFYYDDLFGFESEGKPYWKW